MKKRLLIAGAIILVVTATASFGALKSRDEGNKSITSPVSDGSVEVGQMGARAEPSFRELVGASSTDEAGAPPASQEYRVSNLPEGPGTKVIQSADLQIETKDGQFQTQFSRAGAIAEKFGGFVLSSTTERSKDELSSGWLTLRVPADKFQSALTEMKSLGTVKHDSQSGTDVTSEFIDLEARLRHLNSQEAFYLKLMNEAKTISDMIQIQERLSGIQAQTEQIKGRLQYLKDQTTYSTISARIFEPGVLINDRIGFSGAFARSWNGFKEVVAHFIVGAGWLTPFVLLGALVYGAWRVARRRPRVASASE